MTQRTRILFHCQHLSGTGHYVRTLEIARTLAGYQDVYMTDGGRKIPRPQNKHSIRFIELPRIYRNKGLISAVDSSDPIQSIMQQRSRILQRSINDIRPDVLVVEHFPFSKWSLYDEISGLIDYLKDSNPNAKIICSIRDIVINTCDEPADNKAQKIIDTLHRYFDHIIVHSDPDVIRLDDYISWINDVEIPVDYSGFVSEKPNLQHSSKIRLPSDKKQKIIVSSGGAGDEKIIRRCLDAWQSPAMADITKTKKLVIFCPLYSEFNYSNIKTSDSIEIMPFSTDFLSQLKDAALLISESGYNTCTNILEMRIPALLIPNSSMSDQTPRADVLRNLGLVDTLDAYKLNTSNLVDKIKNRLESPKPEHKINLDGAASTAKFLETCTG